MRSRDSHLNCQRTFNPMVHSIRQQIRWLSFGAEPNLLDRWHPLRPFIHWYHGRIVNDYISKELDQRFAMHREAASEDTDPNTKSDLKRTRTIIDLALSTYTADNPPASPTDAKPAGAIDPFFKQICMSQIKLFLFSGHDTTSSALCFHLYLLAQHPSILTRLRAEHDAVLGPDPSLAASRISASPHLLHQLPYTTAVIKESLRLFPTVTISREGLPGYTVTDERGRAFPTENFLVFPNPHTPQHDPAYWPRADAFLPERWLAKEGEAMYPVKGAWRAFEHGLRGCIGQELAMLEMKIVLVVVARRYVVREAYGEVDGGGEGRSVRGERAYQTALMGPRGDLPCWVERVGREEPQE